MEAEQDDNEGRRWGECDSCGFETWLKEYQAGPPGEGVLAHCEVCANTWIGRASEYPTHYGVDVAVYKSMGRIANMILAEQREQFEIIMTGLFASTPEGFDWKSSTWDEFRERYLNYIKQFR